ASIDAAPKDRKENPNMEPGIRLAVQERDGRGSVALITIDNHKRLNTLNESLILQLTETARSMRDNNSIRAAVLTGEGGRSFIGGADVNEMARLKPESARAYITNLHQACSAIRRMNVPVIARISGHCLGAGLEVAASCDLRIATDHSTFGMPEVRVGIPSVIEAALLPNLIGWGRTRQLLLTGETITAKEALDWGLVNCVVPAAQLDDGVERWVDSILAAGPTAIRLQKALVRQWERLPMDQAIERGIESFVEAYKTDEPRNFMTKFIERRRNVP